MLVRSLIILFSAACLVLASSGDAVATSCADDYSETATLEIESVTVDGKSSSATPGHLIGVARIFRHQDKTLEFQVNSTSDRHWEESLAP